MSESQPRILVVDDERFFREAIDEILKSAHLEVVPVEDASTALESVCDPAVGVVVLDIQLTAVDGIELLRQLLERRPELRVIMLSAASEQERVLEALRLGACDYLAKPLHDEELLLAVQRAIASYRVESDWRRLHTRLDRLASRMEALSGGVRSAGGDAQAEKLREGAVAVATELLGAGRASFLLLEQGEEEEEVFRLAAVAGFPRDPEGVKTVSPAESVAGLALSRGEAILVTDVADPSLAEEDAQLAERVVPDRYASGSFAVAPLRRGERPLGALCVTERIDGGAFGAEDLALLRLLAIQISELLAAEAPAPPPFRPAPSADPEQAVAAERDVELARVICEGMVNQAEPERALSGALRPLARILGATPVSVYLLDTGAGVLRCEAEWDGGSRPDRSTLPAATGLTGTVMQTGHLVATQRPEADPRFEIEADTPEDGRSGPFLCVPLRIRGKVIGVARAFLEAGGQASARTGEVLAAALSAAVRNLLLYRSLIESIEEVAEAHRRASSPAIAPASLVAVRSTPHSGSSRQGP